MQEKVSFKNNKGQKLVGILHIPKGEGSFAGVILSHGLSGNKDAKYKSNLSSQLVKAGIICLKIDMAGHGESQGKFEDVTVTQGIRDIESAVKYLRTIKSVNGNRIGLWGNSLSGGQIPWASLKYKAVKANVIFAPAIDFPTIRLERWKTQKLSDWKKNGFIQFNPHLKLKYRFHLDSKTRVGYKIAPKVSAATLVIQGDKDEIVPLKYVRKFYTKLKCVKKLVVIKNQDHDIGGSRFEKKIIKLSVDWFKKYL